LETGHDAVRVEGYFDLVEDDNDEVAGYSPDDTMIKLYQELKQLRRSSDRRRPWLSVARSLESGGDSSPFTLAG
jgi:hypothetical protein